MGKSIMASLLVLILVMCFGVMAIAMDFDKVDYEEWGTNEQREESGDAQHEGHHHWEFILKESKVLVKCEGGEMRAFRSVGERMSHRSINVGFLSMEGNSLFIPQYLDSSLILFVRSGQANVGVLKHHEVQERQLKAGDLNRISAGSTFYLQNVEQSQRLEIILSIDESEGLRMGTLENFFIGGGSYPKSIIAGFSSEVLTSAFNVSSSEVKQFMTRQHQGPIVSLNQSHPSNLWKKFLIMEEHDRLQELKKMTNSPQEQEDQTQTWSWKNLLNSWSATFQNENKKQNHNENSQQEAFNLYNSKPDFENNYGSSLSVDVSDYSPLKISGMGVYLVNLKAGSMLAPHVNPTATEYGVVLQGSGHLQIVFPNGTLAMKANLKAGSVYWVPRYFPFVQVASSNEQLQIFGFTTSAQANHPQFLAGSSSVLGALKGPQLAGAFGVSEERLNSFVNAQREAVMLPYKGQQQHHEADGIALADL